MITEKDRKQMRNVVNKIRAGKGMMSIEEEEQCANTIKRLAAQFVGWQFDMPHYMKENTDCMGGKTTPYWRMFAQPINGPSRWVIVGHAPEDAGATGALNDVIVKVTSKYPAWQAEM